MHPDFDSDWCYEHMVDKDSCVHCTFPPEELVFMFECPRCAPGKTWGWRGQCIRCIGMHEGSHSIVATRELVLTPC